MMLPYIIINTLHIKLIVEIFLSLLVYLPNQRLSFSPEIVLPIMTLIELYLILGLMGSEFLTC